MMALTHAAIAAAGTALLLSTADPQIIGLAVIGSQLPDIDTSTSVIGQIFSPVSRWLEKRYAHRTVTHSLIVTTAIAMIGYAIGTANGHGWKVSIAVALGHFLSCVSDCFTRQGVQLFWPKPVWCISVSNPNRRLRTGGTGEYWVLSCALALFIFAFQISSTGNVMQAVGRSVGIREEAIEQFNRATSANKLAIANITGYHVSDRRVADGEYIAIENDGIDFVIIDPDGNRYRTGVEIDATSIRITEGDQALISVDEIILNDEPIAPDLEQYRGQFAVITGNLSVEFGDEIQTESELGVIPIITITGDNAEFIATPIDKAIEAIGDQYGSGQLTVKSIAPNPLQLIK
jgi:inner membrane protein